MRNGSLDALEQNLLSKITSTVTDSTVRSTIDAAMPKLLALIEQERNRLANALITGIPFGAASAIAATVTYYYAETTIQRAVGYSVAAALAGGGGVAVLMGLKSEEAKPQDAKTKASILDPYINTASQQLVDQADPKIRAILQEERDRLAGSLQTGLPWAAGGALTALSTALLVPSELLILKIVGWLVTIILSSYAVWVTLDGMKQRMAPAP